MSQKWSVLLLVRYWFSEFVRFGFFSDDTSALCRGFIEPFSPYSYNGVIGIVVNVVVDVMLCAELIWRRCSTSVQSKAVDRSVGNDSPAVRRAGARPRLRHHADRLPCGRTRAQQDRAVRGAAATLRQVRRVRASRQRVVSGRQQQPVRRQPVAARRLHRRSTHHRGRHYHLTSRTPAVT